MFRDMMAQYILPAMSGHETLNAQAGNYNYTVPISSFGQITPEIYACAQTMAHDLSGQ
jgi:hypothetical protein